MQNDVAEIKLRAERRAGELLGEMDLHPPGPAPDRLHGESEPPTLAELGISYSDSHRWQAEASVPETQFDNFLAATREQRGEITSVGLYRIAKERRREARREQNSELVNGSRPVDALAPHPTIVLDPPWELGLNSAIA